MLAYKYDLEIKKKEQVRSTFEFTDIHVYVFSLDLFC